MNGCKVYQLPVNMAGQLSSKNPKGRVCVSEMYISKKKTHRRAIAKVSVTVTKVALSFLMAWLTSLWAIPAAYAERGYNGIGGEWLLIIGAFWFTYWALTSGIRHMVRNARREAAKCRYVGDAEKRSGLSSVQVKKH